MRLDDLAIRTQTPLDTDKVLLEKFRAHERVEFDPRTNLYSFKVSHCTHQYPLYDLELYYSMTTTFVAKQPCSPKSNVRRVVVVVSLCAH
jgi:TFIIE beta subunit core domain